LFFRQARISGNNMAICIRRDNVGIDSYVYG
jgi:hypothetical protein